MRRARALLSARKERPHQIQGRSVISMAQARPDVPGKEARNAPLLGHPLRPLHTPGYLAWQRGQLPEEPLRRPAGVDPGQPGRYPGLEDQGHHAYLPEEGAQPVPDPGLRQEGGPGPRGAVQWRVRPGLTLELVALRPGRSAAFRSWSRGLSLLPPWALVRPPSDKVLERKGGGKHIASPCPRLGALWPALCVNALAEHLFTYLLLMSASPPDSPQSS